jgi:hypothetical protein
MGLKAAFEKLGDTVADLSSLEVLSFTGELKAVVNTAAGDGDLINWEKLITEAKKESGKVELLIASKFNIDGDATLFTSKSEIDDSIRAAHSEAVTAGQQVRKDLMELFKSVIEDAF